MQNEEQQFIERWLSKTTHDLELRALPTKDRIFTRNSKDVLGFMQKHSKHNVYFGVGSREGGGETEHVREISFLWTDIDFDKTPDGEEGARYRLGIIEPRPSIIIHSGGGLHVYWVLTEAVSPSEKIVSVLRGLCAELKSDPAVCDIARIMRLPGTTNHKPEYNPPRPVVIETMTDDEYTLNDFERYIQPEKIKETTPEGSLTAEEINGKCLFLAHAFHNKELPEPLWYSMVSNLARVYPGGISLCHEYSEGYDRYSRKETDNKILHAMDGAGPHTCQYIKSQGFDCGKDCGVSSPIALLTKQVVEVDDPVEPVATDPHIIPEVPFPFYALPDRCMAMVENISEALHIDPEVVASAALTILSGAIGNTVVVSAKQGYDVPVFLWQISIAPTGYGKSPLYKLLMTPIERRQREAYKAYKAARDEYETALRDKRNDKNVVIPDPPCLNSLYVADSTVESLANVFENDPRGTIIFQDELTALVTGMDQYKGKGNDRQHYLELFNAGPWKIDRKSEVRYISNTGAAIVGGIQAQIMPKVFGGDSFTDGLLPRFLLVYAGNKPSKFSRRGIDDSTAQYWENLLDKAYRIPMVFDSFGGIKPKNILLKEDALSMWIDFYDEFMALMPWLSPQGQVFIPKLAAYYSLKLVGVLHILRGLSSSTGNVSGMVDSDTIEAGIAMTRFYAGQAMKVLRLYRNEERFTEQQEHLIKTLFNLKDNVAHGKLPIGIITEQYNDGVPEAVQCNWKQIGGMLKELGFTTKKSTGGRYVVIWEGRRTLQLFDRLGLSVQSGHSGHSGLSVQSGHSGHSGLSGRIFIEKNTYNGDGQHGGFTGSGKHIDVTNAKTVDNTEFTSFPEGSGKTGKQNDDFEEAVRHYMAQGLSESEARFMAREEV